MAKKAAPAAPKGKGGAKILKRVEISRSANGGFMAQHHFDNSGPGYMEPETHTFDNGRDMLNHVAQQFNVNGTAAPKKPAPKTKRSPAETKAMWARISHEMQQGMGKGMPAHG